MNNIHSLLDQFYFSQVPETPYLLNKRHKIDILKHLIMQASPMNRIKLSTYLLSTQEKMDLNGKEILAGHFLDKNSGLLFSETQENDLIINWMSPKTYVFPILYPNDKILISYEKDVLYFTLIEKVNFSLEEYNEKSQDLAKRCLECLYTHIYYCLKNDFKSIEDYTIQQLLDGIIDVAGEGMNSQKIQDAHASYISNEDLSNLVQDLNNFLKDKDIYKLFQVYKEFYEKTYDS